MRNEKPNNSDIGAPGFRLERLELWNWGTFHGDAQTLEPRGGWTLLIGDNGSGKSTAIDALRTLLVPPRILNYNDASGDGRRVAARDRSRRSYIRGAWASSSTIDSTRATTQFLRDPGVLSAIAAVFADSCRNKATTVAQILWEHEEQVKELYAIIPDRRSLSDLLANHSNTAEIRRAARRSGWEIEDSFAPYAERMRGLLHIPGDKALEVFNRAIGMKEVGDIDAFVRHFMLPSTDTYAFIRDTVQPHYRTLLDCWTAIERAERQIALLRPVAEHAARISDAEGRIQSWRNLQDLAQPFYAMGHLNLLRIQENELATSMKSIEAAQERATLQIAAYHSERDVLNASIATTDVGPRLQALARELFHAEQSHKAALSRRGRLEPVACLLSMESSLSTETSFAQAQPVWEEQERRQGQIASESEELRATRKHQQELFLQERSDKVAERESVERHRVNIPRDYLTIRMLVAQASGVSPETMPFAGELIEVRRQYSEWTGAIERLLRSFGLSLLVPEAFYRLAAEFINSNRLGLKLTFHHIPARGMPVPNLSNDRVPGRLEFRTEHPLHAWVATELARRFDHRCCESISELETVNRGLTRQGLVREGSRHVKDDARALDAPGAWILGWSTERKITALRSQIAEAERQAELEGKGVVEAGRNAETARKRQNAARELLTITDFSEIDGARWNAEMLRLQQEQKQLETNSDQLRVLRTQLQDVDSALRVRGRELADINSQLGSFRDRLTTSRKQIADRKRQIERFPGYDHESAEKSFTEIAGLQALTLENAESLMTAAHNSLQGRISNDQRKINESLERMLAGMSEFLKDFSEFSQTMQVGQAYAEAFAAALLRIEQEDLPRHRERFEHFLNENLVGDLLMLNRRLDEHREAIDARIDEINQALKGIRYRDDTYVQLRLANRSDPAVAAFRPALRDCFEHGIAPSPGDRLMIFERIRKLLEEFKRDPEATQRVTDVRTWVAAGVRELRRADDVEIDYLASTTGKSGGQKAKLAFTILASALSAQYGLSTAPSDAPNFRLVVIDEAFSRTDEFNSTSAMDLFASLGFQLLIVGPFDAKAKLAVPFVKTIHLASNPGGNRSQLVALTREQVETATGRYPEGNVGDAVAAN